MQCVHALHGMPGRVQAQAGDFIHHRQVEHLPCQERSRQGHIEGDGRGRLRCGGGSAGRHWRRGGQGHSREIEQGERAPVQQQDAQTCQR